MNTLIIIPTLNESKNIEVLINKIFKLYKGVNILIVDDNSTDGTLSILNRLRVKKKRLEIITRKKIKVLDLHIYVELIMHIKKNFLYV